jgi:hypothetical protein
MNANTVRMYCKVILDHNLKYVGIKSFVDDLNEPGTVHSGVALLLRPIEVKPGFLICLESYMFFHILFLTHSFFIYILLA